jgi:hypothetical protein
MQVALRNYENGILEKAYENVRDKCGDGRKKQSPKNDIINEKEDDSNDLELQDIFDNEQENDEDEINNDIVVDENAFDGEFEMSFGPVSNLSTGERNYVMKWNDGRKNAIKTKVNNNFVQGIIWKASRTNQLSSFSVRGFTCYKQNMDGKQVIYRATDMYRGGPWNDFCMVDYGNQGSFPSKIFGFVQYLSGGISSNSTTNHEDKCMYAVIQCSAKPLRTSFIDEHFITTFRLGTNYDSFDVVPVESIMHPMLAVPSFGSTSDDLYVTATPYEQWGKYFENEMRRIHRDEEMQHKRQLEKMNMIKEKKREARARSNKKKRKFTL